MIEVIEESRDWLVVDKPSGLPVHATNLDEPDLLTLVTPEGEHWHVVHRLDRETSGLVLIAKRSSVASDMMKTWSATTEKKYAALIAGTPEWTEARWDLPLSETAEGRKDPQGSKSKWKDCLTLVEVLGPHASGGTLLECDLKTGRKHQIRRHAALAGFPIVGDDRYGGPKAKRLMLHAWKLSIKYRGLPLSWESPLPF